MENQQPNKSLPANSKLATPESKVSRRRASIASVTQPPFLPTSSDRTRRGSFSTTIAPPGAKQRQIGRRMSVNVEGKMVDQIRKNSRMGRMSVISNAGTRLSPPPRRKGSADYTERRIISGAGRKTSFSMSAGLFKAALEGSARSNPRLPVVSVYERRSSDTPSTASSERNSVFEKPTRAPEITEEEKPTTTTTTTQNAHTRVWIFPLFMVILAILVSYIPQVLRDIGVDNWPKNRGESLLFVLRLTGSCFALLYFRDCHSSISENWTISMSVSAICTILSLLGVFELKITMLPHLSTFIAVDIWINLMGRIKFSQNKGQIFRHSLHILVLFITLGSLVADFSFPVFPHIQNEKVVTYFLRLTGFLLSVSLYAMIVLAKALNCVLVPSYYFILEGILLAGVAVHIFFQEHWEHETFVTVPWVIISLYAFGLSTTFSDSLSLEFCEVAVILFLWMYGRRRRHKVSISVPTDKDITILKNELDESRTALRGSISEKTRLSQLLDQSESDFAKLRNKADSQSDFLIKYSQLLQKRISSLIQHNGLLQDTDLNNVQREYLTASTRITDSLFQLSEDVDFIAKVSTGRAVPESRSFNPHALAEEIMTAASHLELAHDTQVSTMPLAVPGPDGALHPSTSNDSDKVSRVEFIVDVEDDVPLWLVGDAGLTRRAVTVLLENAFKYTQDGQICLKVSVVNQQTSFVSISFAVHDTGSGVDTLYAQDIYRPFFSTPGYHGGFESGSETTLGSGMGLYLCSRISKLLGGTLSHVSDAMGSVFILTLSYSLNPMANTNTIPGIGLPLPVGSVSMTELKALTGLSVVILMKNGTTERVLARILRGLRCNVTITRNPTDLLKIVDGERLGVFIIDYHCSSSGKNEENKTPDKTLLDAVEKPTTRIVNGIDLINAIRLKVWDSVQTNVTRPNHMSPGIRRLKAERGVRTKSLPIGKMPTASSLGVSVESVRKESPSKLRAASPSTALGRSPLNPAVADSGRKYSSRPATPKKAGPKFTSSLFPATILVVSPKERTELSIQSPQWADAILCTPITVVPLVHSLAALASGPPTIVSPATQGTTQGMRGESSSSNVSPLVRRLRNASPTSFAAARNRTMSQPVRRDPLFAPTIRVSRPSLTNEFESMPGSIDSLQSTELPNLVTSSRENVISYLKRSIGSLPILFGNEKVRVPKPAHRSMDDLTVGVSKQKRHMRIHSSDSSSVPSSTMKKTQSELHIEQPRGRRRSKDSSDLAEHSSDISPQERPQKIAIHRRRASLSGQIMRKTTARRSTVKPIVLIAEDNPTNLNILSTVFEKHGYHVFTAENGKTAVDMFVAHHTDIILVVMDTEMPLMNGLTATRSIRKYERQHELRPVPVIGLFVTDGASLPQNEGTRVAQQGEDCLSAGASAVVPKPVDFRYLMVVAESLRPAVQGRLDISPSSEPLDLSEDSSVSPMGLMGSRTSPSDIVQPRVLTTSLISMETPLFRELSDGSGVGKKTRVNISPEREKEMSKKDRRRFIAMKANVAGRESPLNDEIRSKSLTLRSLSGSLKHRRTKTLSSTSKSRISSMRGDIATSPQRDNRSRSNSSASPRRTDQDIARLVPPSTPQRVTPSLSADAVKE